MKAALIQLNGTDDPATNLEVTRAAVRDAAGQGARFVLTPEVTNVVSASRTHQEEVLCTEERDPTLAALRGTAAECRIELLIGSLALKTGDSDGRFANRSFLIGADGGICARYDKIHMFDVQVSEAETYRESSGYRPGDAAAIVEAQVGRIGMTICYDLRFPHLYRALAKAGADILTVPSAFSPVTGAAHWESLLRARAIETGCFVLAPAQCGDHAVRRGRARSTYGHSLAVAPWGEVLADGGTAPGTIFVDLDLAEVGRARAKVPSLGHDRPFRLV